MTDYSCLDLPCDRSLQQQKQQLRLWLGRRRLLRTCADCTAVCNMRQASGRHMLLEPGLCPTTNEHRLCNHARRHHTPEHEDNEACDYDTAVRCVLHWQGVKHRQRYVRVWCVCQRAGCVSACRACRRQPHAVMTVAFAAQTHGRSSTPRLRCVFAAITTRTPLIFGYGGFV